jgi:hypothetical protein
MKQNSEYTGKRSSLSAEKALNELHWMPPNPLLGAFFC